MSIATDLSLKTCKRVAIGAAAVSTIFESLGFRLLTPRQYLSHNGVFIHIHFLEHFEIDAFLLNHKC